MQLTCTTDGHGAGTEETGVTDSRELSGLLNQVSGVSRKTGPGGRVPSWAAWRTEPTPLSASTSLSPHDSPSCGGTEALGAGPTRVLVALFY